MQQDTLVLPYSSIENTTHTDGAFDCIRDVNEAFDLRVDPTFFELQEKLQGMALQLTHRDLRSGSTQSDLGKLLFMAAGREELDWTPFTESHAKVWAELGKPALAALWREYGELGRRIPLQWHGPDAGRDGCAFADPKAARAALTDLNLRVQQAFDKSDIGEHTLSTCLLDKWNVRGCLKKRSTTIGPNV
ncbi:hypothetical protein [Tropicibacter naphthalenivorans]|uniref:Uncharacterized protein n=1 Tax=Tropicibacter naphthalenivorans TaxID=441103 RepID=A0A0P1GV21_9RHOB|nr:hypothetical protein [Tropicibacter naphthalenivorans]CUH78924.1 hypothetical protein TRN7648_02238 [Tropicibacter naphthalenivorans]SMD10418.1 hypothetical protein SAMN04488093_12213 [Tropicibacter naphthalenivorans]